MKIDWSLLLNRYSLIISILTALGLGGWAADAIPMFQGGHDADINRLQQEITQTGGKLDQYACMQIVINYENAKKAGDINMMAYWLQQAKIFNCTLPS